MRIQHFVPFVALALSACGGTDSINPTLGSSAMEANSGSGGGEHKVTICHIPPGNPANAHTITVGAPAIPAHIGHGDTLGACGTCGDGVRSAAEQCDGTDLDGNDCASLGYVGGTLTCDANCQLVTAGCASCGNGQIDAGEECDGTDLGGATCASLGFTDGTLTCTSNCTRDSSGCTTAPPPECSSCNDCGGQACVGGTCGACASNADCCAPLLCFAGTCTLF